MEDIKDYCKEFFGNMAEVSWLLMTMILGIPALLITPFAMVSELVKMFIQDYRGTTVFMDICLWYMEHCYFKCLIIALELINEAFDLNRDFTEMFRHSTKEVIENCKKVVL